VVAGLVAAVHRVAPRQVVAAQDQPRLAPLDQSTQAAVVVVAGTTVALLAAQVSSSSESVPHKQSKEGNKNGTCSTH
jgi:hypothetical protein